ncbi:competence type IV pilus major pilin ComGC [Butyrivibrio sp. MB2005]|uniref:competence type IV pilus major pilin ComGC n=1 Tax=Butyrivibrio sp. MB2005 TaxID=1280678 RepID=UPI000422B582|nr:prepilin-type N-terminal cleavage/methylation domain-containing protein [Butyrivibrio sp. MB2005]
MKKMLKRLNSQEGFTLAELLIVVAIIAVLVAVSIPVFTNQLEKAREATDAANIRSAVAEVTVGYLNLDDTSDTTGLTKTVSLQQKTDGWITDPAFTGFDISGAPSEGGSAEISCDSEGKVTCTFG